jgi:hypothetical protein
MGYRNTRLKSLREFCISSTYEVANREILAIASALRDNKGLVDLAISPDTAMGDESWGAICDFLKTLKHPTLQVLDLETILSDGVAPAVLNLRIQVLVQALVDMLKVNMSYPGSWCT